MEQYLINLEAVLYSGMVAMMFFTATIVWIFSTHTSFPVK